jgi:hypothetical protein
LMIRARVAPLTGTSLDIIARRSAAQPCKYLKIKDKLWRREWDSNFPASFRFCKLQIPQCHGCRECQRCRGALPAIARGLGGIVTAVGLDSSVCTTIPLSNVIKRHAATFAERGARVCDATQKLRVVLEPVIEPVVLGREPDQ